MFRGDASDAVRGQDDWSRSVKAYYRDIETYDWVDVADHIRGPEAIFHRARQRLIRKVVSQFPHASYLDAGCGTGLILRDLPPTSIGLDLNPRNIDLVRQRLPQHMAIVGDIEGMPFNSSSFDGAVCTEVLEHVPNPVLALIELNRVLKPGGVLIGTVPARSPIWRLRFLSSTCPHDEPFHHQYSASQIVNMLESFKILTVRYVLLGTNVLFIARKTVTLG